MTGATTFPALRQTQRREKTRASPFPLSSYRILLVYLNLSFSPILLYSVTSDFNGEEVPNSPLAS